MDFLRDEISALAGIRTMCFSGRGGEVPSADGSWIKVTRDEAKRRFKEGLADVLLCTDAAAEGLNFQFCGALVNYDMPWNPMRVEQRIGRIDRLGQKHAVIRIINLHYEGTVETDVYRALRSRIGLFQSVIGRLQPILSQLPSRIAATVLTDRAHQEDERSRVVGEIEAALQGGGQSGFDIDAATEGELTQPMRADARLNLRDLDRLLGNEKAMPPGISVQPLSARDYRYSAPGMEPLRITTDRNFFEEHAESVELWSPGSPLFPEPESVANIGELPGDVALARLLGTASERS